MRARDMEQGPRSQYSYLVRSSAKYECPFFGPDGKLRRRRVQASELGTAFAYEAVGNDTYLLTNEHVAVWPEVTDGLHRIEGVPEGCKRVEDKLRIVRDERDDFEPGQIALPARGGRPAAGRGDPEGEPEADRVALQDRQERRAAPGERGRRARLPAGRDAGGVQRQGRQPLRSRSGTGLGPRRLRRRRAAVRGKLRQPGDGRVVPLARAGAGRRLPRRLQGPQRAERRRRHRSAHRVHAQEAARPARAGVGGIAGRAGSRRARRASRRRCRAGTLPLFDFGGIVVRAEPIDSALLYHLYGRQFPLDDRRIVVIEDLAKSGAFGEMGRLWVLGPTGWREWPPGALGTDERELLGRVVDSIRLQMVHTHRLPPRAGQSRVAGGTPPWPRGVAHDRARRAAGARPGRQPARDRRPPVGRARDRAAVHGQRSGATAAATPPPSAAPPAPSPLPARGVP